MNSRWSLGTKLTLFAVFAVLFAGMLIALSGRYQKSEAYDFTTENGKRDYDKEFTVNLNDNLYVDVDFGDVIIVGSSDNKVHVKVTMRGDEDYVERYPVEIEQEGNTVRVTQKQHSRHFHFFDGDNYDAKYEISVPKEFNLDLSTSGGNLNLSDVKGDIKGNTSGGDLDLSKLDGTITVSTSGGNVYARELTGTLDLETSGGDIVVESSSGVLKTETSGGNIKITDVDAEVRASTSGGNIRARLQSNKGIRLSTSGGNITLALPSTATGDVDADATGGNVSCDLPFQGKIKDDNMRGKINGGGSEISLETSGGSIEIVERNQ